MPRGGTEADPLFGTLRSPMRVSDQDLTAVARIRNAALEGFARDGVAATSIRDVAKAADVSAGLVQHHFRTKGDLERAVNEYVVQIATEAYEGFEESTATATTDELLHAMGERITEFVREHRSALLYVIRSAAQGEEAGLNIFDAFYAIIDAQVQRLAEEGALRDDVDRLWVGLHVVIFNLGTALLEPAINRHLAGSFRDPDELERWNRAATEVMHNGVIKPQKGA
jgi:AcrR family transcriptional regulator